MHSNAAGNRNHPILRFLATGLLAAAASAGLCAVDGTTVARVAGIGVPFVANQGQVDSRVAFYARTFAGTVFVTTDGRLVYSLRSQPGTAGRSRPAAPGAPGGWTLAESFTSAPLTPAGLRPALTRISDFTGRASGSGSDLASYEMVGLGEVAPGVSLDLRASGNNVEKLFQVAPGADARGIRVRIDGAGTLSLAADGSLVVGTGLGEVQLTAPIAYQIRAGERIAIPARYELAAAGEYGFSVGAHDPTLPLTIDPLIRSTYSGGGAPDVIRAMLIHPGSSDVYVAGSTTSVDFPGTTGGGQPSGQGSSEAFVARYNSELTTLLRASYFGGGGLDIAYAIAILPSSGDIYIAGTTSSPSFPALAAENVYGALSGGTDAFIAQFDGALTNIKGARYLGGSGDESAAGLAIDNLGAEVIVAGETTSNDLMLGAGAQQPGTGGGQDGFVARFSSNLAGLVRASYFGGAGSDRALSLARDPLTGDIVVAGVTDSTNLPGTANGALPASGGLKDGFVARFDGGLTVLHQSTYFGGTADDQINAIAIHPINGRIYATGDTASPALRGKPSGQLIPGGNLDSFVARFHQDLSGLQAVSYYGGIGDDSAHALGISKYSGEIYIAGSSASPTLPGTPSGIQEINAGGTDAYVARFDAGLTAVRQATFLGGLGSDFANALALTESRTYVAGETSSAMLAGAAPAGVQPAIGGSSDGFISALGKDLGLGNSTPAAFAFPAIVNALPSSVQTSAPAAVMPTGNAVGYVDGQPGSTWCSSSAPNCTSCDRTGGGFVSGSWALPTTAPNPYYVCVRHTASAAPGVITESTMHIGAAAATFRVGTGAIPGFGCTLDIDGDGTQSALTDGLLVIRALFGLTGTSVTNGAVADGAPRSGWSDISLYLNTNCGASVAP